MRQVLRQQKALSQDLTQQVERFSTTRYSFLQAL